jgi:hypothetical protein
MRFPSRMTIPVLVGAATLIVCSLGVRAELNTAKNSIAERRLQTQPPQQSAGTIAATREEQRAVALRKDAATP